MSNQTLIPAPPKTTLPDWAIPEKDKSVEGELIAGIPQNVWTEFIGLVATGSRVGDAQTATGLTSYRVQGRVRTDPTSKEQYEDARLEAVRRDWDPEDVEEILTRMSMREHNGHLNKIVKSMGRDPAKFHQLIRRDPITKELYEEARIIQAEVTADDIRDIASESEHDTYIDAKGRRKVDNEVVQRSRLRVDTEKWLMSKLHHKRFGDKLQQETTVELKVDHVSKLDAGRKRLEALDKKRKI